MDLASLRDDVNVLTAIVQRLDNSHTRLLGTVNLSGRVSRIDVAGKVVQKFIANPHCRFRPRSGISRLCLPIMPSEHSADGDRRAK
jgi:hypothetical protein